MCIIIIKQRGRTVDEQILENSADINPHGLGVVWLDSYQIEYFKSSEYYVLNTDRPYIAHFRYATVGHVSKGNTHPFRCGRNKHEWLMQNGSIYSLGSKTMTDTEHLAHILGTMHRSKWADYLDQYDSRFVTVNTKLKTFQVYNKDLWHKHEGVWYSKTNVFASELLAVYGTLKKGHSNYWHYLYDSKHVGVGVTADKYPLVINSLPYVAEMKGVGHNVAVDVFRVDADTLHHIDQLEGHPTWYYRKQIPIIVQGKELMCWLYFNPVDVTADTVLHQSYEQAYSYAPYRKYSTYKRYDDWDWGDYESKYEKELDEWLEREEAAFAESCCPFCEFSGTHESDGYGYVYCHNCNEWFTEKQIVNI